MTSRTPVASLTSRDTSREVSRLLQATLVAAAPEHLSAASATPDLLEAVAGQLGDATLADAPLVKAELHHTLGTTYHRLWMPKHAIAQLRAALALFEQERGSEHPDTARCTLSLGRLWSHEGHGCGEVLRDLRQLGSGHAAPPVGRR